ncbi:unnamed protein product [Tenebrio molitor]|nr:unnamed protein product [Tenebrio molitor]
MKTVSGGFWRVLNRHDIIILMGTTPTISTFLCLDISLGDITSLLSSF